MTIALREDILYILLEKIAHSSNENKQAKDISFTEADFAGREMTQANLLGHLDYLSQEGYIDAEFEGSDYATQNVFDPHTIEFKKANLTEKGKQFLQKMKDNKPETLKQGPASPVTSENQPFLEKVKIKAELEDIFDARDVTEVVFRTMRDVMTTETSTRVAEELQGEQAVPSDNQSLQDDISQLWQDTNPIVALLSRIRPVLNIKDETFLFRIRQEGGLQRGIDPETVLYAVFSATKDELSQQRVQEIAETLPGKIRQIWEKA